MMVFRIIPVALFILIFARFSAAQCPSYPTNFFGNDTLMPCGATLQLSAPEDYTNYLWSTGSTQNAITVSQPGNYTCSANATLESIVVNGDFSMGNTGFISDYNLGLGGAWGLLSNEGTFAIAANANQTHNNFSNCFNHTTGNASGSMLVVNGAATPNSVVWGQTVNVQPNTNYQFSVWAASVVSDNPGILNFAINGTQLGTPLNLTPVNCNWQQFFVTWNSGTNTTADISIVNLNTSNAGNDFALDDIAFSPVCTFTSSIAVSYPPNPTISTSGNVSICQGDSTTITANSNAENASFNWSPGNLSGNSISIAPVSSTVYAVNATDENGCVSPTVQVVVNVAPAPQLTITSDTTICAGLSINLGVSANMSVGDFVWNNGEHTGNQWEVSPSENTNYHVQTTSTQNSCPASASVFVTVIPELTIAIIGENSYCEGSSLTLNAEANADGTTFFWTPANTSNAAIIIDNDFQGWVYLSGQIGACPPSVDSMNVAVIPLPDLFVPQDTVVCPGQSVVALVSSSNNSANFEWSNGLNTSNPEIQVYENTEFVVFAVFNGCYSEPDTFSILTTGFCGLELPNVFTPNDDGTNDFFQLISFEGIESVDLVILNRWGNVVFESNNPNFAWSGKNNAGNVLPEGTYFYKINAISYAGETFNKHGFVSLVK